MSPFFRGYLPSAPPSPGGTARACCLLMPHASPFGIKPRELGVGVVDPVALGPLLPWVSTTAVTYAAVSIDGYKAGLRGASPHRGPISFLTAVL
jgi:hypothetical protein